jgi:hypothetical protein
MKEKVKPLCPECIHYYQVSRHHEAEVVRFLSAHRYLLPILLDAVPHIKRVFGPSPVYLEVEHDPDEGFEELFGVVMVEAEPEKALDLLGRFDQEWFAKVVRRTRSRLNFTVDTTGTSSPHLPCCSTRSWCIPILPAATSNREAPKL